MLCITRQVGESLQFFHQDLDPRFREAVVTYSIKHPLRDAYDCPRISLAVLLGEEWIYVCLEKGNAITLKMGPCVFVTIEYAEARTCDRVRFRIETDDCIRVVRCQGIDPSIEDGSTLRPDASRTPKCDKDASRGVGASGRVVGPAANPSNQAVAS